MSDTTRNKGIRKRPAPIDPEEESAYKRPAVYGRTSSVVPAASVPTVAQEVPAVHDLYTPRSDAIAELHNLELPGEVTGEFEEKPTRLIRQLIAYGPPRPGNSSRVLVPFADFEKKERKRAGFVIEGLVSALPKTDEDFEFDDEDEETTIRMRLDKVEQVSMDLDLFNEYVRRVPLRNCSQKYSSAQSESRPPRRHTSLRVYTLTTECTTRNTISLANAPRQCWS
jgi:hypothetical protein